MWTAVKLSGCVPTFYGRRAAGRRPPSRSSFITATAGRNGSLSTTSSGPIFCAPRSVSRSVRIRWAWAACARNTRPRWRRRRMRGLSRSCRPGWARAAPNSATSPAPPRRSIRSTDFCATCRCAIRMRAQFRHRRQRPPALHKQGAGFSRWARNAACGSRACTARARGRIDCAMIVLRSARRAQQQALMRRVGNADARGHRVALPIC